MSLALKATRCTTLSPDGTVQSGHSDLPIAEFFQLHLQLLWLQTYTQSEMADRSDCRLCRRWSIIWNYLLTDISNLILICQSFRWVFCVCVFVFFYPQIGFFRLVLSSLLGNWPNFDCPWPFPRIQPVKQIALAKECKKTKQQYNDFNTGKVQL